jgi:hypothetical protein
MKRRKVRIRRHRRRTRKSGSIIVKSHNRLIKRKKLKTSKRLNSINQFYKKKLSKLEYKDFKDYRHLKTILEELAKPVEEWDEFSLRYAMGEFIRYIRDKLKNPKPSDPYWQHKLATKWGWWTDRESDESFENSLEKQTFDKIFLFFDELRNLLHENNNIRTVIYPQSTKRFFDELSEL